MIVEIFPQKKEFAVRTFGAPRGRRPAGRLLRPGDHGEQPRVAGGASLEQQQHGQASSTTCRFFGRDGWARLGDEEQSCAIWVLGSVIERFGGGIEILFRVNGREEEGFGCVVEPFSAGAVGRESVAGVEMHVQQIANGGAILVAAQAAHRIGSGRESVLAGGGTQSWHAPGEKASRSSGEGAGGPLGGISTGAHAGHDSVPGVGCRVEGFRSRDLIQREAAGARGATVAGLTVSLQNGLRLGKTQVASVSRWQEGHE